MPQLAGVFGDCIAGGGYMPIISDRVYMTEQAYMVIAGAALIKGAKSEKITSLDIGGPEVHVHQSRLRRRPRAQRRGRSSTSLRRDVERLALEQRRRLLPRRRGGRWASGFPATELSGIIPTDHREGYDAEADPRPPLRSEPLLGADARRGPKR